LSQGLANLRDEENQEGGELDLAQQLWIHILSYAVGSARIAFDAAVSGYYAQSYTMTRNVFETYLIYKFTRSDPNQAKRWFVGANGEPPKPWRTPKIIEQLNESDDKLIQAVIQTYHRIKGMAHPSEKVLQQSVTFDEGVFQIGPNYIPDMCSSTLYEGANAFGFVLGLLEQLGSQPAKWSDDLRTVLLDLSNAKHRHNKKIEEFRSRQHIGDEWIVRKRFEDDTE
jgi:hypothetical protein